VTSLGERAVLIEGVGKRYVKYEDAPMLATSVLNVVRRSRRSSLWAVRGVNLQINPGECVGIIGRNGSGKSTLLQMMAGITAPTEGRVRVRGRIAPLISVGVGFHPELSGRDNLFVNGAILGLTRAEVNQRFDEVVAFAELENFIDTPVKFYSSGMIVRLGFSMAIHSVPDVLIVDEVLAVGDVAFQLKCFDRMKELRSHGTTIVVVSHSMGAVRGLCDRALLLHQGQPYFEGDTAQTISKMHELLNAPVRAEDPLPDDRSTIEHGVIEVAAVELINEAGEKTNHLDFGEQARVRFHITALQDVADPYVAAVMVSEGGVPVFGTSNRGEPYPSLRAGETTTYDVVWPVRLANGTYLLRPVVGRMASKYEERKLAMPDPVSFFVGGELARIGLVDLGATYERSAS
jgi:ABC-type polysaccharide/polyol phosphate transport system ATPase subunit